jgi:hypothetical protein
MLLTTAHDSASAANLALRKCKRLILSFFFCVLASQLHVTMSITPEAAALSIKVAVLEEQLLLKDQELQLVKRSLAHALQLPGAIASQALAQDRAVRQRAAAVSASPLEDDALLDKIFGLVGNGEYFYVAAVCRRWRGRYITLCYRATAKDLEEEEAAEKAEAEAGEEVDEDEKIERDERKSLLQSKLRTGFAGAVTTAVRFQMALDDKLTVAQLQTGQFGNYVAHHSLEPVAVFSLAKQYDLRFNPDYCLWAAVTNKLDLLQFLHSRGCPWDIDSILRNMICWTLDLPLLKWMRTKSGPWAAAHKAKLLQIAVRTENYPAAEWLREQGAAWPNSFLSGVPYWIEWTLPTVKYAIEHGAAWGDWDCQRFSPQAAVQHLCLSSQQRSKELLDWAHANGCPCTCDQAQA